MIYIICALSAEARLFLDHYKLKQYTTLPFKVYESSEVKLIISGVGYNNALLATTALLAHFTPKKDAILLNIGVAAAPRKFALDSLVVAHKINYKTQTFYPDILFSHNHEEADLTTFDSPQESEGKSVVDMEAHAVFQAASRFMQTHQMAFVKLISDHFEPEKVTKELILKSFKNSSSDIFSLINKISSVQNNSSLFNDEELKLIESYKRLFTKSQFQQFYDASSFYKLKRKKRLPLEAVADIKSKQQRSDYLQDVIKQLTH